MASSSSALTSMLPMGWGEIDVTINEVTYVVPWLQILELAVDILEWTGVIPDPFQLLFSLFAGRPKEEATLQAAQRLSNARNPAARLTAVAWQRMVKEFDIVLSTEGSGRAILDLTTQQFVDNLQAQGITQARAFQILENATSEAAQHGLPLEPELTQPLPAGMTTFGSQQAITELENNYENAIQSGHTIQQALKLAEQSLWKNLELRFLYQLRFGKWAQLRPEPGQLIPDTSGKCPADYTLDPTTKFCVLNVQPTPTPTPTPTPQPGPIPAGQPDPDGDEITNTLCAQIQAAAQNIIDNLPTASSATGADPTCCANIVSAIANLLTPLGTIATNIAALAAPGEPATPIDLTPITEALNRIGAALDTPGAPLVNPTPPVVPEPFTPKPYTAADAENDVQAAIGVLPNLTPAPNA